MRTHLATTKQTPKSVHMDVFSLHDSTFSFLYYQNHLNYSLNLLLSYTSCPLPFLLLVPTKCGSSVVWIWNVPGRFMCLSLVPECQFRGGALGEWLKHEGFDSFRDSFFDWLRMPLRGGGSCGNKDCLEEADHGEFVLKGMPCAQPAPNTLLPGCREVSSTTILSSLMLETLQAHSNGVT